MTPVGSLGSEAKKWADFYLVAGSSAAVLIGLLFVALTIHGAAIAAHPYRGGQARQTIYALASIIVASLLVLIPDQSAPTLGAELMIGALLNLLLAVRRQVRRLHAMPATARRASAVGIAIYDGAMLLIIAGGVALTAGFNSGLYFFAPAVIALALLAIANSWILTLSAASQLDLRASVSSFASPPHTHHLTSRALSTLAAMAERATRQRTGGRVAS